MRVAKACKEAIRLKPDFSPAHYNLGSSYAALEKYEEAIDSYKEAIRIKFDYPEGHLDLGAAYFHTGRIEEAIVSYKQVVE
jgi:tetratricopeptide (TPR) repeat protein